MNIGIHVSLWTPEWDSPFLDAIDVAADLGFDCVEIPLMTPFAFPLEDVKKRLERHKLRVYCGTGLNRTTDIGSTDESVRENGIRHLSACIDICGELGADSLGGVLHSPWGMRGVPSEGYARNAVTSLARVADTADTRGVSIALECINRYENSFINTVRQGLAVLEKIDRHNVGLHLDTYHMNIEENNIKQAIIEAGRLIGRIHLSENNRGYPGDGSLPWDEIVAAIQSTGYAGPWIIESYVDPRFPASSDVSVWRAIEPDKVSSLQRSLDFLRSLIENR